MTEVVPIMRIDRKSSIEFEPRTLNFQQIQSARDAALCVLNSRSIEEANQIFTEGMVPVVAGASRNTPWIIPTSGCRDEEKDVYQTYSNQHLIMDTSREAFTAPF
ncbi:uncharacterized protein LOC110736597 [Chenopodium quinoa]|uniref:uncharacterized protein LOC110736597 n=1 Tax=Chenopodium quinoa TaxID=63459 RepID=UPI000B793DEB|nr:uncharacterized protein LOC110736597 [Chenopodium quinoa]